MDQSDLRITKPDKPPTDAEISGWIGRKAYLYWQQVTKFIEQFYPAVFEPEWLYGGKKHGWSLRYKKSKSFCTLIPEKNRFALLIVFGAEERAKVEGIKNNLSRQTQEAYDKAVVYHDGKWVLLTIDNNEIIRDVKCLLAVKRKRKGLY